MSANDTTREYHERMQGLRRELVALEGGGEGDGAAAAAPRRVSSTTAYHDAVELLQLALTRTSPRSYTESVDLTRNAKGETQITVSGQAHEGETLAECADRVTEVYKTLRDRFPLASGYVGAEQAGGGS